MPDIAKFNFTRTDLMKSAFFLHRKKIIEAVLMNIAAAAIILWFIHSLKSVSRPQNTEYYFLLFAFTVACIISYVILSFFVKSHFTNYLGRLSVELQDHILVYQASEKKIELNLREIDHYKEVKNFLFLKAPQQYVVLPLTGKFIPESFVKKLKSKLDFEKEKKIDLNPNS